MKAPSRRPRAPAPGARRIENAARRLFGNQGYAGTSMAEIAAAAGVSKATVFHHYRSKRALYEALVGDALAGFREQLIPLLDAERDLQDSLGNFAAAHVERVRAPVPAVEVADHGDALRVGCPDGEAHAGHARERHRHRAQHPPRLEQPALVEEMQIEVADGRREAVGIDDLRLAALRLDDEPVGCGRRGSETRGVEVARPVARERQVTIVGPEPHSRRCRPEGAVDESRAIAVQSEEGARVVHARRGQAVARTASGRRGICRFHDRIIVSVFGPRVPERRAEARRTS